MNMYSFALAKSAVGYLREFPFQLLLLGVRLRIRNPRRFAVRSRGMTVRFLCRVRRNVEESAYCRR